MGTGPQPEPDPTCAGAPECLSGHHLEPATRPDPIARYPPGRL